MTLSKPLREVNGLCFFVGFQHVPLLSHGHLLIAIWNIRCRAQPILQILSPSEELGQDVSVSFGGGYNP